MNARLRSWIRELRSGGGDGGGGGVRLVLSAKPSASSCLSSCFVLGGKRKEGWVPGKEKGIEGL